MKRLICLLCLMLIAGAAQAQDMRDAARRAEADRSAAEQRARETLAAIFADEARLTAEVQRLEAQQADLEGEISRLGGQLDDGGRRLSELAAQWSESELEFREISGNVRLAARDLKALLEQSPLTALTPDRIDAVSPILADGYFPDIDDIETMVGLYLDEARRSGEVGHHEAAFVGRDGVAARGDILTIGRFTAIYRSDDEIGYLRYAPESRKFHALTGLPARGETRRLRAYLEGESGSVTVDLSGGTALSQVTQRRSLADQMRDGGPIVYPILLIALAALVIIIVKIVILNRVGRDTGATMTRVIDLVAAGDWDACRNFIDRHADDHAPAIAVITAGLEARREDRETLDSVLQESILHEMPRLESGLSILAVLGAVAPLLGLLGTVTGMIETFRVITVFGTGDPRLMSGGISEALVTTELGLAVAIPVMLLHTFLSRRVERIIGDMEEKAVTLANTIHKHRSEGARAS